MRPDLHVGTLWMPDRCRVRDPRGFVAGLGLEPGSGDRSVLVVRRLLVPPDDPALARRRLKDLWAHAAEPANGPVDEHAVAVRFRDEEEALACLCAEVLAGTAAGHWWWQRRLPRHTTSETDTLAVLWLAEPRWVPAVLTHLHRLHPARTAATLAALPERVARDLLAAVVAEHLPGLAVSSRDPEGPDPGPPDPARARAVPPAAPADRQEGRPTRRRESVAGGPEAAPETSPRLTSAEVLLELALVLTEHPRLARTAQFEAWLAAPVGRPTVRDRGSTDTHPVQRRISAADGPAPTEPTEERADPPAPAEGDPRTPADERGPGLRLVRSHEEGPPDEADPGGAWRYRPWQASGPAVPTELASMLYAVNLVVRFDLGRLAKASTGWAVVESLARLLLRGLPAADRRSLGADPLFALLAELDTRPPGAGNPVRLGAAFRPVRDYLALHRIGVDTFTRPGSVVVSRTHVDVVLGLDQIDLDARAMGLDRDPGWVPELGRIVLFHFDGGAR